MTHYILRCTDRGTSPDHVRERIAKLPDVKIVDESARMLLVEGPPETINKLTQELPGLTATLERHIPLPDPRPKLRSS
jgi:hypothetical protein